MLACEAGVPLSAFLRWCLLTRSPSRPLTLGIFRKAGAQSPILVTRVKAAKGQPGQR